MASRVEFAVSATPIYTHSAGEGTSVDTIASDVNKTLGGSGSQATTWGTTEGYASGAAVYKSATTSVDSLDTLTSIVFLFIKHSGYTTSNLDVSTSADSKLTVSLGDTAVIAILSPGDAIVLPYATATSPDIKVKSDSGTIAVEYMATFVVTP